MAKKIKVRGHLRRTKTGKVTEVRSYLRRLGRRRKAKARAKIKAKQKWIRAETLLVDSKGKIKEGYIWADIDRDKIEDQVHFWKRKGYYGYIANVSLSSAKKGKGRKKKKKK